MAESKLKKVVLTFDDGSVEILSGEDADKWSRMVNSALALAQVHGMSCSEKLNWQVFEGGVSEDVPA